MRKQLLADLAIAAAITLAGLAAAAPADAATDYRTNVTVAGDDTGIFHRYATQAECKHAGEATGRSFVCVYHSVFALPWELRLS